MPSSWGSVWRPSRAATEAATGNGFIRGLLTGPETKECSLWLDTFSPGAETPRHYCVTEQVVTILSGTGTAMVDGRQVTEECVRLLPAGRR